MIGKKIATKVAGVGKKVGSAGLSIGKKVVKVAGVIGAVGATAIGVHSAVTEQSIGDSAVDAIEFGKDTIETGRDVVETQKLKAKIENISGDKDKTRITRAKEIKDEMKQSAKDKAERNRKRQEGGRESKEKV